MTVGGIVVLEIEVDTAAAILLDHSYKHSLSRFLKK
jgi:hypothetical protein